ncbi:MAG: hypothetical protein U0175_37185 [Caldilineaceae bacterium]
MQPSKSTTMHYQTFLFTMWQESADEGSTAQNWRFSLTDPHTMQRVGFGTLEKLVQYLQQRMEEGQAYPIDSSS